MSRKQSGKKRQASEAGSPPTRPAKKQAADTSSNAAPQDFPRGGGTGMAPLEYRHIVKQAEQDLFAEHAPSTTVSNNAKPAKTPRKPQSEQEHKARKKQQREQRNLSKHKQGTSTVTPTDDQDKELGPSHVSGLTFKRLALGSLLHGMITKIGDLSLTVALPNSLVGRVAITEICDSITQRAEAAALQADNDEDGNDMDTDTPAVDDMEVDSQTDTSLPDLSKLFYVGQWVHCSVVGLDGGSDANDAEDRRPATAAGKRPRKHIDLSLRVEQVNAGLATLDLMPGLSLSAVVNSVEEHGYLLDIGVNGKSAFLLRKDAKEYEDRRLAGRPLIVGQPLIVTVTEKTGPGRVVQVSAHPDRVARATINDPLSNVSSLLPGELVVARITRVLPNGLACRILDFFDGTIDIAHISAEVRTERELSNRYKVGDQITGRILYVCMSVAHKAIGLSLLPHVVSGSLPPSVSSEMAGVKGTLGPRHGTIIDVATVRRVDHNLGLLCDIPILPGLVGYVHISRVADRFVQSISGTSGPFAVGTAHRARVIGYDPVDAVVQLSLQPSVLDCPYLTIADLPIGEKVKCTVQKLTPMGMVVEITETPLSGFVPSLQLADVTLKHPEKKFKLGDRITARVLHTDAENSRVVLTLKRTLVQSTLPLIVGCDSAMRGEWVHGYVIAVKEFGCIVGFYGNTRALCPLRELSESSSGDELRHFHVGQPVRCRVLNVDTEKQRIIVSFRESSTPHQPTNSSAELSAIHIGQLVSARITELRKDMIVLSLVDSNIRAALPHAHLSDHCGAHTARILSTLKVDQVLDSLLVLTKNEQRNHLLLSRKPLLVDAARAGSIHRSIDDINTGDLLPGYVAGTTGHSVFIDLLGGLCARAGKHSLADRYVAAPADLFLTNQTVICLVTDVDRETSRIEVTLKRSLLPADMAKQQLQLVRSLFEDELLAKISGPVTSAPPQPGDQARVTIEQQQSYGWIVRLNEQVTGLVTLEHCKEVKAECGDTAPAKVLDYDRERGIADLSMRPALLASSSDDCGGDSTASSSKKGKKKGKKGRAPDDAADGAATALKTALDTGVEQQATIELVKEDYLVLSLPQFGQSIAFAAAKTLNDRSMPFSRFKPGQRITVKLMARSSAESTISRIYAAIVPHDTASIGSRLMSTAAEAGLDLTTRSIVNPVDASLKTMADIQPGRVLQARVLSHKDLQVHVSIGDGLKGRILVTEAFNRFEDIKHPDQPLTCFRTGQVVSCTVVGWHRVRSHRALSITNREATASEVVELSLRTDSASFGERTLLGAFTVGQLVTGFVRTVADKYLLVALSEQVVGRVEAMQATSDANAWVKLASRFTVGMAVPCRILAMDIANKRVDLGIVGGEQTPLLSFDDLKIGAHVAGQIASVAIERGLTVRIGRSIYGRVALTDISDSYAENPTTAYRVNQVVSQAKVVALDKEKQQAVLSLRESEFNSDITPKDRVVSSALDVAPGDILRGFVRRISDKGCFLAIGRHFDAMVKIAEMSDSFVQDWKSLVRVGQLVQGRVLSVDKLSNHVQMSLKTSSVRGKPTISLTDLSPGMKVKATVKKIEKYGVFLAVDGSRVSGLCHISQVSDTQISDLSKVYSTGDRVKAVVLEVDMTKNRISFGLKASYFEDDEMVSASEAEESDSDTSSVADDLEDMERDESDDDMSADEDSDAVVDDDDSEDDEDADEDDDDDEEEEEEEELDESEQNPPAARIPALELATTGFSWEGSDTEQDANDLTTLAEMDSDVDEAATKKKNKKKAKQAGSSGIDALAFPDVTADLAESAPSTAADYERLLVGSPNSSYLWINYMAFQLQMSELERTRDIAERALKTIHSREGQERMNVWLAWMNMENSYGTHDALESVFRRAVQFNDPKLIYLQLVRIYERSGKTDLAEALFKTMIKKFGQSAKVWIQYGLYQLMHGNVNAARQLLQRALKSLPQRKHIKVISRFAQLEFKHGEPERGRTIFEGIMSNYPKRLDLWSIYLDMEMRYGEKEMTRRLFQRVLSLKFSSKKMKFLFKKWLAWEQSLGDEGDMEEVKRRALSYVQST